MLNKLLLLPGLLLVLAAGSLVLRAEPATVALRKAEALWQSGRAGEARLQFMALARNDAPPIVAVRLAQIHLLRGECTVAQMYVARAFRTVTSRPLRRDEAALAHLVAGQCAVRAGNLTYANSEWSAIDPRSPWRAMADVLRGEQALRSGQDENASNNFQRALANQVVEPVRSLVNQRLALAVADRNVPTALQHLGQIADKLPAAPVDARPFMPVTVEQIVVEARQLEAILRSEPRRRSQLLGQLLLDLELYQRAIRQFEKVPPADSEAVLARGYAALARWRFGQKEAAVAQLRELVEVAPQHPFVATLYATLMVEQGALDAADGALDVAEAAHPLDPAIMVVRSDVLVARHNYAAAVAERRRAFELAQPEAQGRYALTLADLHLSLTYQLCDAGVEAARTAVALSPDDPMTWQVLAASLYHCREYSAAADAVRRGLQQVPKNASLEFFLGASLWNNGQRREAYDHLRNAVDLAPASEWRRRAEELLGWSASQSAFGGDHVQSWLEELPIRLRPTFPRNDV